MYNKYIPIHAYVKEQAGQIREDQDFHLIQNYIENTAEKNVYVGGRTRINLKG